MTGLLVRLASDGDLSLVRRLRVDWGRSHGAEPSQEFDAAFATWWSGVGRDRLFWLAMDADEPVGMLNLQVFDRMPMPDRIRSAWGYVANVYVTPERRGEGVGSALLSSCIAHADAQGLARLVLAPSESSRSLYQRHGFGPADELVLRPDGAP